MRRSKRTQPLQSVRKIKLEILHLSQEVSNNALTQQPATEQEGAMRGSSATKVVDVSGQEAATQ